jgi:thiol-disulfide isomerase/thioredoxin
MKRSWMLLWAAALLWSCGPLDNDVGGPSDRSEYPSGPYGTQEGRVVEDLSFVAMDGSPFSLGDVFANEKNRVLLLTSVAGWCQPCVQEQPQLAALHAEYGARGLVVAAAMFENDPLEKATLDHVRSWHGKYKLPYRMVLDADFALDPFYVTKKTPPMNLLVRVDDMKILKVTAGFDEQLTRSIIEANLPKP